MHKMFFYKKTIKVQQFWPKLDETAFCRPMFAIITDLNADTS